MVRRFAEDMFELSALSLFFGTVMVWVSVLT